MELSPALKKVYCEELDKVFNSIHEKLSEKFSINSFVAFNKFSFLHQKS